MRNLLLKIAYDGAHYHGWQIQQNAVSVQQVFQEALFRLLGGQTDIKACSRTDTGVHAREFCISFHTKCEIPENRFPFALNRFLPADIAVLSCSEQKPDFHARYSCRGKQYCYEIWNTQIRNPFLDGRALHYWHPLDAALLDGAAKSYLGAHDFTSFCTLDQRKIGDMTRTVTEAAVRREGDKVLFTVAADGFLYNMVRIMVGTLLRVQQGKIPSDGIAAVIAACDRNAAGPTAPACGLYLNRVYYETQKEVTL